MLTRLTVRNFKRFDDVQIDLTPAVVFIGPNNSGKTTALQALALLDAGLRQWLTKRQSGSKSEAAKAVTIGRKDLVYLPLSTAKALWHALKVREGYREDGKTKTRNILIDVLVEGVGAKGAWTCGFEFEYSSEEFFYCRPLRLSDDEKPQRMAVPVEMVENFRVAFLPPLGGLLMDEPLLQPGRVDVLLGSGHSGEVLRNLCYSLHENQQSNGWALVVGQMRNVFGIQLKDPVFVTQQGTLELDYQAYEGGPTLPITSAGLGMLQTLLLLVYLHLKPGALLLLDEPDAHLEVLRQRQIYQTLVDTARNQGSQVICASHSEVVLNEAVGRDTVVAFVGKPHVVADKQGVLRALQDYGFEHYIQAEQTGWVLYLEGSTDLSILRAWAKLLQHPAQAALERPFVHYLNCNTPALARKHFNAVREAHAGLVGIALFDRLEKQSQSEQNGLLEIQWSKREIENYFATRPVLLGFAHGKPKEDLLEVSEAQAREQAMNEAIAEVEQAVQVLGGDLWSDDRKASEEVLPQVLKRYVGKMKNVGIQDARIPTSKNQYHNLIDYQTAADIDGQVQAVLSQIVDVAQRAKSLG